MNRSATSRLLGHVADELMWADGREFDLVRYKDVSEVSGTGIVADGIEYTDGSVVIAWHGEHPSTVVWRSIEDAIAIHGHGGLTQIRYRDTGGST